MGVGRDALISTVATRLTNEHASRRGGRAPTARQRNVRAKFCWRAAPAAVPGDFEMTDRINIQELQETVPPLHKFAQYLTRNKDDANDLVHDSIERALRNQHRFEPGTNLRAWLFTICKRQFLDKVRRRRTMGIHVTLESAPQSAFSVQASQEPLMQLRDVVRSFHRLPHKDKVILSLIVIDGLSYDEAGTLLHLPVGTVRSRLSRARKRLKGLLGSDDAAASPGADVPVQ